MKLFKKLLPIASLATVAAVTVPLVTACKQGNGITGIKENIVDLFLYGHKRTVEALPATTASMTAEQGFTTYLQAIQDNKNLLADDLFELLTFVEGGIMSTPVIPTPVLTDIEGNLTIGNASANVEKKTISCAIGIDALIPIDAAASIGTIYIDIDAKLEIKNFGVRMECEKEPLIVSGHPYYIWNVCADYMRILEPINGEATRDLRTDEDWSITLTGTVNLPPFAGLTGDVNLDVKLDHNADQAILVALSSFLAADASGDSIGIPAMYLKNVVPAMNADKE